MSVKIMGVYVDYKYRDYASGFTIFRIRPQLTAQIADKVKGGYVFCKGVIPELNKAIPMEFIGEWESNEYGWTFQVEYFTEKSYDIMLTEDFLKSIKGVSPEQAKIIAETYEDFFTFAKRPDAANEICRISGLSIEKAQEICLTVVEQSAKKDIMQYIFKHGGRMHNVEKIYLNYGAEGIERLKEDPYKVGQKVGLKLSSCDSIAREMGLEAHNKERLNAYIISYLENRKMAGDVYVLLKTVEQEVGDKLKDVKSGYINTRLVFSDLWEKVCYEDRVCVYLKYLYQAENNLAAHLMRLQNSAIDTNYTDALREYAEKTVGIEFAEEQRNAFRLLKRTGVGILTGGPGTGKTSTVKGILTAYEKMCPEGVIKLCAPTGRAAQRMAESTGREATTIHRLLEYKPFGSSEDIRCKNEYEPIDADLIVVDEVSMLDCQLASLFFAAVKTGTMVIMVGDINQLQSVGAGDVLNDLIKSGKIPVERLIKTYRQAEGSLIIKNAQAINQGHEALATSEDFEIITDPDITEKVKEIVMKYHKSDDPFYCQVLSPTHKGNGGVGELNQYLQKMLNPDDKPTLIYGKRKFKVDDKVLLTKNNPAKGYYNGDVGVITDINGDAITVDIQGESIILERDLLNDLQLSYAMTIHKSQGSEFPVVVVALPNCGMLKRNLLYTAVTRAKDAVIIIQQNGSISIAVKKNEVGKRNTTLIDRLNGK